MLRHNEILNPCKCGSKQKPLLDSDDMVPCWTVYCRDCKQDVHDPNWTLDGAVITWNDINKEDQIWKTIRYIEKEIESIPVEIIHKFESK